MSLKTNLKSFGNSTEELINEKLGTTIDFFTDPKTQEVRDEVSTETHKKTEKIKTEVDPKKSEILSKVKTGITEGFNKLKAKIPDKTIEEGKDKGKTYLQVIEAKYNSIIEKLDNCKNDGELYSKYKEIRLEIVSWIEELSQKETGLMEGLFALGTGLEAIKKETVNGLDNLRVELTRFEGKDAVEKMKAEIKEKYKEDEGNEKIKSMLTEVGVPVGLAGLIAGFLGFFGIGKDSKMVGFFSSLMEAFKDPVGGFKNLFGFGGKKDEKEKEKSGEKKEESKQEEVIAKGEIKEDGKFTTYTNTNIEIKTEEKKVKQIILNGKKYEFNLDDIGEISFIQKNDKDYIKIGDKEIDLFTFIGQIKEQKDNYMVSQNFSDGKDLKLEIVT